MIETVLDQYPMPECARHLGLDILEADKAKRHVRVAFLARPEFANASGAVQGGFLAAMLDDSIGPAILIATDAEFYPVTISLNVTFLAPARIGPLFGEATVRQLGKSIAYVEASLFDDAGVEIARATSSVRVVPMSKALPLVK